VEYESGVGYEMGISINVKPLELKDGVSVFSCTRSGSITEDDADNKVCV